jgi:hypothetical protein
VKINLDGKGIIQGENMEGENHRNKEIGFIKQGQNKSGCLDPGKDFRGWLVVEDTIGRALGSLRMLGLYVECFLAALERGKYIQVLLYTRCFYNIMSLNR